MTTRGRRSLRGSGRAAKRSTNWVDSQINQTTANATQDTQSLLSGLGPEDIPGITLTRTIIHLWVGAILPGVASGAMRLDWGIGVVQGEALAAGIVADPFSESDFPNRGWVVRDVIGVHDSIDTFDHRFMEIQMDIHSQRKLYSQDAEVMLVLDANDLLGTPFTVLTFGYIRCLYKMA